MGILRYNFDLNMNYYIANIIKYGQFYCEEKYFLRFYEEEEAGMDVHLNKVHQILLLFPFYKFIRVIHVETRP